MFIIFGAPRSGTTLLSSSLNLNDSIVIPHETDFIVPMSFVCRSVKDETVGRALIGQLITSGERFPHSVGEFLTAQEVIDAVHGCAYNFHVILETLYGRIAQKAGKTLAGDKSPNDLFFVKRLIGPRGFLQSGIRIIHLVRDVRAVIVSLKKVEWAPQGIANYFARSWSEANLYLHNYLKNSPNYLFMKFEEMVCDPERTFRIVTDFLGVPFQEKMFDSNRRWARYNGTMHHENLQCDFMPEKSNAWKEEIDLSLLRRVEKQAHEALETFGYERRPWPGAICSTLPGKKVNQNPHPKKNRAICILGMHRSGTSAIARVVNLLGPYIGSPEHLMKPVEGDNPHGFWEHWSVFSLHERLLSHLCSSWDSILPLPQDWWKQPQIGPYKEELKQLIEAFFSGQQLWMWKDPRTALLLPLWKEVMQELDIEVNYVICVRNPLDVAASLSRRNNFSKDKSLALWLLYNVSALLWTNGAKRIVLNYDDLLEDWERSLRKVSASFGIPWPRDKNEFRKAMGGFIRPEERHSHSDAELLLHDEEVAEPVKKVYRLVLEALEKNDILDSEAFSGEVEHMYRDYCAYVGMLAPRSPGWGEPRWDHQIQKINTGDKREEVCCSEAPGDVGPPATPPLPEEIHEMVFPAFSTCRASIIIPVWNHWTYTYRCLRAILANTGEVAYEVIIVDNGSTDKTGEILAKAENIRVIRNQSNAGYAVACNQGAGIALGDYLVFLNNDTEPLPNWLKELVSAADADPKTGAMGGKLIYPDGRLQEAGGMAFSDGRSWNFGNGDNPDEEIYNVMCEVDYCSGACLLVRRRLFDAVGGFDVRYSPAYYEDTNLCFSLRQKGYKVIYNPDVCIIHHESVTSGMDESSGFRKYLEINRQKFIEKWADELSRQDTSPWEGRVPVTACRERLLREDLTQEDVIYLPNGGKAVRRRHSFPMRIDKSILYGSFREKEEKAAEITAEAVRRYGNEYVGVAWSGGEDSVALLHVVRQAFGGRIPVKVISFLSGEDPPGEHRFIERLSGKWGFDMLMPSVGPSSEVREDHDAHLNPPSEALFRTVVERLHLKALITGRRGDGPELETPSVYFSHEDNPRYVRVQPMLHFRKVDVWHYIKKYDVPLCEVGLLSPVLSCPECAEGPASQATGQKVHNDRCDDGKRGRHEGK